MTRQNPRSRSSSVVQRYTAGAIATVAASISGAAVALAGVVPVFDPIGWLAAPLGDHLVLGLGVHLVVGLVVLPELYRLLSRRSTIRQAGLRGLVFGLVVWWLALLLVLPAIGASVFGLIIGWPVPLALLLVHVVYGTTLGLFQT